MVSPFFKIRVDTARLPIQRPNSMTVNLTAGGEIHMKNGKWLKLVCVALVFSNTSGFAGSIETPRELVPVIKVSDSEALRAYLVSLVEEFEDKKVSNDKDNLTVYLDDTENPCKLDEKAVKLTCEYSYLLDRWNGEVSAEFAVENGKMVRLTEISFTGNL